MSTIATTSRTRAMRLMLHSGRTGGNAAGELRFIEFVERSTRRLDIAAYEFRSAAAIDVVAAAAKRIPVRIVIDGAQSSTIEPKHGTTYEALEIAGLAAHTTLLYRDGGRTMNHRFMVRDGCEVWTGGTTFTDGGFHLQDTGAISFESPELSSSYHQEIDRLISGDAAEPKASEAAHVGSAKIQCFFGSGTREAILQALRRPRTEKVRVMSYAINDPEILEALRAVQKANIDIRGMYDPHGMRTVAENGPAELFWFLNDPRFTPAPSGRFHPYGESNAFCQRILVIDEIVFVGSYSGVSGVESRDENVLRIESRPLALMATRYHDALTTRYREPKTDDNA